MNEIAIIIPSRLAAERLPNKPLEKINNKQYRSQARRKYESKNNRSCRSH